MKELFTIHTIQCTALVHYNKALFLFCDAFNKNVEPTDHCGQVDSNLGLSPGGHGFEFCSGMEFFIRYKFMFHSCKSKNSFFVNVWLKPSHKFLCSYFFPSWKIIEIIQIPVSIIIMIQYYVTFKVPERIFPPAMKFNLLYCQKIIYSWNCLQQISGIYVDEKHIQNHQGK